MKRPWLIVDGYNVIAADPALRRLADRDLDAARARLVSLVGAHAAGANRAIVVFDGGGNPSSLGEPHHVAGAAVLFSPAGQDADTVIEALAMRARDRREEASVVTSDAATQWTVLGSGITRVSSRAFLAEISASDAAWREHNPSGAPRTNVADRIAPDVRERLALWARGG